jgi:PHD/YefM family antitoxin component YafN of YafNO toxin-antitoxin module
MFKSADVRSMTEFQRKTKAAMARLKKTGRPELLTVNGKAALVVQDAEAFTRMIDHMDRQHLIEAVRVGIEQMEAGKTRPWRDVKRDLQARIASKRGQTA